MSAVPPDARAVLGELEANGLTILPTAKEETHDRGYRNTSSSFAVVRDVLSTVFPDADADAHISDDKTQLVIVLSGANSMLLLLVPGKGGSPVTLDEAASAAEARSDVLRIRCAGRAAAEAVALLLRVREAKSQRAKASAETIAQTHAAVREAFSDDDAVVALWGAPEKLKELVHGPPPPTSTTASASATTTAGASATTVAVRCLSYTSIGDSASIASLSGAGMLVSDVDVLSFLPDARVGTGGRDRVLSLFTCPVGIFSGPQPSGGAEILEGAFRALAASGAGAEHVIMTNFLLTQSDIAMAEGIDAALREENMRLGIESGGAGVETYLDAPGSKPQAFRVYSPISLQLRTSELLYQRGGRAERLRRYVATVDAANMRYAEYLQPGDVLVLSRQPDARQNGPYFVERGTRTRLDLVSHWELKVPENSGLQVDLQTREASFPLRGASGALWYARAPCVVRLIGGSENAYLVCRAERVSVTNDTERTLHLRIISAQPYDRASELDATSEHVALGTGFTCFPVALNGNGVLPSRDSCSDRGGVWDRPCDADEECPFYDSRRNRGGCDSATGGFCEMPLGVERVSFRRFTGRPLLDPPGFAFESLLKK